MNFDEDDDNAFGVDPRFKTAMTRVETYGRTGLNKAEQFVYKHSQGPAIPALTAIAGFFVLGPLGALIGAGIGYGGAKVAHKQLASKGGAASGPVPPTGYKNLAAAPSRGLQMKASQFLTSLGKGITKDKLGRTAKIAMDGKNYLFRIEMHVPAPERGLPTAHPGVTVYEKV